MSKKLKYDPSDFVCNVPIEEKLRRVPEDAEWWVHQWSTSDHFEIGRICREAYNKLNEQQAEIEALKAKLNKYHLKEDLDRNLNLIYGKELLK